MTRHALIDKDECVCGYVSDDFNALVIHLIRCNGGEFIVSDTCGRGKSGDEASRATGALTEPDITEYRAKNRTSPASF